MHLVNVNFSSNSSRKKWPTHKKTIGLTSTHIVYKFSEVGKGGGSIKIQQPKNWQNVWFGIYAYNLLILLVTHQVVELHIAV